MSKSLRYGRSYEWCAKFLKASFFYVKDGKFAVLIRKCLLYLLRIGFVVLFFKFYSVCIQLFLFYISLSLVVLLIYASN